MNKTSGFSRGRIEEAMRAVDVRSRAKAASPVASGVDRLHGVSVRANRDPFGGRYDDSL